MANIPTYLRALEARLAPSVDAQALQERLTEAENHLRDRAQEFEEVGLSSAEAEARAVAAFGAPEEYAEDVPTQAAPPVATPRIASRPTRGLALQLAGSAMGLGIVAMLTQDHAVEIAGAAVVAILGLAALSGRPTPIRRMGALALASAAAAFLIMVGFYEPIPSSGYHAERLGVRLRGTSSNVDFAYREATRSLARFERARKAHDRALAAPQIWSSGGVDLELRPSREGYVGLSTLIDDAWSWRGEDAYVYALGMNTLRNYGTQEEADEAWRRDGDLVQGRLQEAVAKAKPIDPQLSEGGFILRCLLMARGLPRVDGGRPGACPDHPHGLLRLPPPRAAVPSPRLRRAGTVVRVPRVEGDVRAPGTHVRQVERRGGRRGPVRLAQAPATLRHRTLARSIDPRS